MIRHAEVGSEQELLCAALYLIDKKIVGCRVDVVTQSHTVNK